MKNKDHASWTRQDKTFAVMKFSDRPDAIAFPHAFILTVKILNQEQQELQADEMGAKAVKPESEKSVASSAESGEPSQPLSENTNENRKVVDGAVPMDVLIPEKENSDNKEISWSLRIRSRLKDTNSPAVSNSTLRNYVQPEDYESNERSTISNKIDDVNLDSNSSMNEDEKKECYWQDKTSDELSKDRASELALPNISQTSKLDLQDDSSNSSKDSQSDSASLPYQYLIERDIERELENSRLAASREESNNAICVRGAISPFDPSHTSDVTDVNIINDVDSVDVSIDDNINDKVNESSRDSRKSSSGSSGKLRSRQNSKDSDLPPPDVANLRSSDITDLVMKGLMFTIRQDKDTVTVMEQRTKLELDEVLENSEKVETKEGDPCLLNSSLLRLEKMVTRMQEPPVTSLPEQRRNGAFDNPLVSFVDLVGNSGGINEADVAEKKDMYQNTNSLETANCWSNIFTNENLSNSTLEKLEKVALGDTNLCADDDNHSNNVELKLEEEDIIPEPLTNSTLLDGALDSMSKTLMLGDEFQELLMDDLEINDEMLDDSKEATEVSYKQLHNSLEINGTSLTKDSSKLPKVISNHVITNEQIPNVLLKALKTKVLSQKCSVNKVYDKNENNSVNNNEIDIKNNRNEMEPNVDGLVENNIETNVEKLKENNVISNKIILDTDENVENNSNSFTELKSANNTEKNLDTSSEFVNSRKIKKSIVKKNDEIPISNLDLIENPRLTRSNSKLYATSDNSNIKTSKSVRYMETRAQKTLEKYDKKSNNIIEDTITLVNNKRKRNISDKSVSKIFKSVNNNGIVQNEVKVKVWKLVNDLKYGVKVVVERMDIAKIPKN